MEKHILLTCKEERKTSRRIKHPLIKNQQAKLVQVQLEDTLDGEGNDNVYRSFSWACFSLSGSGLIPFVLLTLGLIIITENIVLMSATHMAAITPLL